MIKIVKSTTCLFIKFDGEPLKVVVPSDEDILSDKLTAFAPKTMDNPTPNANHVISDQHTILFQISY